jgi:predicted glycogen debranching enzyme
VWTYDVDGIIVERKVFMLHGRNATVIRWRVLSGGKKSDIRLEVKPLLALIDHHHLNRESRDLRLAYRTVESKVIVQSGERSPTVNFSHSSADIIETGFWYRNFEYAIEKERGFEFHEDLFQPFAISFDLGSTADLVISTDEFVVAEIERLERAEIRRRHALVSKSAAKTDLAKQLTLAADQFIVSRGNGQTVIAGYPWFSDWGRDTMISLCGLSLATDRPALAKNILLEFSNHISEGMLPNWFPDEGETADYNSVDATLWYFEAIRAYVEKTGDE